MHHGCAAKVQVTKHETCMFRGEHIHPASVAKETIEELKKNQLKLKQIINYHLLFILLK